MTDVVLIVIAISVLYVMWRILEITFSLIDEFWEAYDCLCRKGAVNPVCPRHGWEEAEFVSVELKDGARASSSR